MGWRRPELEGALLDLQLDFVDAGIAAHGALRRHAVAAGDGLDGRSELGFGKAAHLRHQRDRPPTVPRRT
jgi:hypothetical protein